MISFLQDILLPNFGKCGSSEVCARGPGIELNFTLNNLHLFDISEYVFK